MGSSITHIKCRWENGIQIFYDAATNETVRAMAPMWFSDDFLGHGGLLLGNTVDIWESLDVSAAGDASPAMLADTATGVFNIKMDATDEAQDSLLYFGDSTDICVLNDVQFETRLAMAVTPGTGVAAVWGMCGDHNLDKDTTAESAWFRLQASAALLCESDDATTDNDDKSAATTLVAGDYHIYRIDFSNLSSVKFYVDGSRVATGTTFDIDQLTTTTGLFQPYFSLDKASGTGLGSLYIDYVRIWGARSSRVDNS